jgi:hypothetical protein
MMGFVESAFRLSTTPLKLSSGNLHISIFLALLVNFCLEFGNRSLRIP